MLTVTQKELNRAYEFVNKLAKETSINEPDSTLRVRVFPEEAKVFKDSEDVYMLSFRYHANIGSGKWIVDEDINVLEPEDFVDDER